MIIKNILSAIQVSLAPQLLTIKRFFNFNKNSSKQETEPEYIYLWHASKHKFSAIDFTKIGAHSIKFGYGIYFSRDKQCAIDHATGAKYLYRVDLLKKDFENLLKLEQPIFKQPPNIHNVAKKLSSYEPLASRNPILEASGHSLYKAACSASGGNLTGIQYEKLGVDLLIKNGIFGAILKDHEEIIVLYDPTLCIIRACESLEASHENSRCTQSL